MLRFRQHDVITGRLQHFLQAGEHLGAAGFGQAGHHHGDGVGRGRRQRTGGRLGRYPSSLTAASIFSRSLSETCSGVRSARDTVMVPTPASCATSANVTLPVLRRFYRSTCLIPTEMRARHKMVRAGSRRRGFDDPRMRHILPRYPKEREKLWLTPCRGAAF